MRKTTVSIVAVLAIALAGCSSNNEPTPTPVPSNSVNSPTATTEAPRPTVEPTTEEVPEPAPTRTSDEGDSGEVNPTPRPTPAPTTSQPETPATQFAQRWGKKYPQVPEYAILKAANRTCDLLNVAGDNWNDDPLIVSGLQEAITAFGLASSDAVTFAQDAQQNYCSSTSNPT